MTKILLLFFFTFQFITAHTQKKDTIRIHSYETGRYRFNLIIKNNIEFSFTDMYLTDTLKGGLVHLNGKYSLFVDTNHIDKWQKRMYNGVKNGLQLIWNQETKSPLLNVSFDNRNWVYLDTSNVSSAITGTYFTSTGFVGCTVAIKENGVISLEPFNDVGVYESKDTALWTRKGQALILKGNSFIDKWFTDNKRFYLLPYHLVGKKVQKTKLSYIETYSYFAKATLEE